MEVELSGDHSEFKWIDPEDAETEAFVSDVVEMIKKVQSVTTK